MIGFKRILLKIFKKKFKEEKSVLIFSDPRSGSTWLAELLSNIPNSCIVNEPLNLNNVKQIRDLNFGWRQYIPTGASNDKVRNFFSLLFSGRLPNPILYHKNRFDKTILSEIGIFKIIRGKLLLGYILKNFKFRSKPILLVRHPLAVLHSMKLHSAWNFKFTPFEVPETIYNDKFIQHKTFFESLRSQEEMMIGLWSLCNAELLDSNDLHRKCIFMFYEDLVKFPKSELDRIFSEWNSNCPKSIDSLIKVPSETVGSSYEENVDLQLSKWTSFFSKDEKNRYQRILDYFDIKTYSVDSIYPSKFF